MLRGGQEHRARAVDDNTAVVDNPACCRGKLVHGGRPAGRLRRPPDINTVLISTAAWVTLGLHLRYICVTLALYNAMPCNFCHTCNTVHRCDALARVGGAPPGPPAPPRAAPSCCDKNKYFTIVKAYWVAF
jgi:hypothetical protein